MNSQNQEYGSGGEEASTGPSTSHRPAASSNAGGLPSMTSQQTPMATSSATVTVTITQAETPDQSEEILRLTLQPRPNVTWDEAVIDNEGLGRKSSKRCCIFHKPREFGESSTDSSDDNASDGSSSSGGPGTGNSKPIARKKILLGLKKKVPDSQRFHA